jgi:hypothetical protein
MIPVFLDSARKHKNLARTYKNWLPDDVIPEFREVFGQTSNVPKVLGLALLWAVMDGSLDNRVPTFVLHRIRTEYESVKRLPEGVNPVKKVRASWCS